MAKMGVQSLADLVWVDDKLDIEPSSMMNALLYQGLISFLCKPFYVPYVLSLFENAPESPSRKEGPAAPPKNRGLKVPPLTNGGDLGAARSAKGENRLRPCAETLSRKGDGVSPEKSFTVLFVDDDYSVRMTSGRLLRANGYKVMTFESAEGFLVSDRDQSED